MTRISKLKKENFTVISNKVLRDDRLSWKARGIFAYIYAQKDNWEFYETEVMKHATDGRDSLRKGLGELEEFGYLKRTRKRDDHGKVGASEWVISDEPMLENQTQVKPKTGKPMLDKPMLDKPTLENQTLINTNQINTNTTNTNSKKITSSSNEQDTVPYKKIIDYLNQKAGTKYRSNTSLNQSLIRSRYNEGFTVEDFVQVINNKTTEWKSDEKMSKYLRPKTLFGTNFESYLNQQVTTNNKKESEFERKASNYTF